MGVFVWALAPFLVCFGAVFCLPRFRWRNASLAGGFAGRRFLCGCGFCFVASIDLLIPRTLCPCTEFCLLTLM